MPLAPSVLGIEKLTRRFGETLAVDEVSFGVSAGEIVGLLGPNGAGKTTIINMVLGVTAPTAGTIRIDGHDLSKRRARVAEHTNFAAAASPLPGNLTVAENLRFFGMLYGVRDLSRRIDEQLASYDLERFRRTRAGVLSSGEQARLSLAKATLNRPRLLLLDEPTASLDPATADDMRRGIRALVAPGTCAVLWTSHNMREVEQVCDRVLFLSHGRILLEGNPRTLPAEHGHDTLERLFIAVAREPLTLAGSGER